MKKQEARKVGRPLADSQIAIVRLAFSTFSKAGIRTRAEIICINSCLLAEPMNPQTLVVGWMITGSWESGKIEAETGSGNSMHCGVSVCLLKASRSRARTKRFSETETTVKLLYAADSPPISPAPVLFYNPTDCLKCLFETLTGNSCSTLYFTYTIAFRSNSNRYSLILLSTLLSTKHACHLLLQVLR